MYFLRFEFACCRYILAYLSRYLSGWGLKLSRSIESDLVRVL